jgi:folate-binding protein YgfZ
MRLPLHDLHQRLGARFAERHGVEIPLDYGDPEVEHRAVRQTVGLIDVSDGGRLHGGGPDIGGVLHGVVTNEVKHLPIGMGCLAVLLNDVGRARTLLVILRGEEDFWIETPPALAEATRDMIDYYIITEDATIDDVSGQWGELSLQGPKARAVLEAVLEAPLPSLDLPEHAHLVVGGWRVARRTRTGEDGYDLWIPIDALPAAWERLLGAVEAAGGGPVGHAALDVLRIEAGIARYYDDLDETVIPLETGLMEAISENKGCYLGQEIIARIMNLSKPVRTFVTLRPEAEVKPGDKLVLGEKEVGRVSSAAHSPTFGPIALGYIRTDLVARGVTEVVVGATRATLQREPLVRAADAPVAGVPPSPSVKKLLP